MSPLGNFVVLPMLVPMITAVLCLFAWRNTSAQKILCVTGSVVHLIVGIVLMRGVLEHGVLATSAGDWPVPFGIVMAMDVLSAVMVLLTGVMATAVSIYSMVDIDSGRLSHGFCPLFQTLIMGVSGAFTTGDLFNLYVQFEVMLTSSFVLLAIGSNRRQLMGSVKYVTLNLVASAIFLAAVGLLYGLTGTLNMADLSETLSETNSPGLVTMIGTMLIVAFGMKAAAFPMFFWLPASYHAPPPAISAIFSGLLTKVGLYSLIRAFTLLFTVNLGWTHGLILSLAAITMVVGVLGAVTQGELRRLLSFQIVSHIGYILMGLGLMVGLSGDDTVATKQAVALALTGGIFYTMHHIVTATNLFLLAGVIERVGGTGRMARLGGMSKAKPLLAVLFMVSALSLAGVPPFSGFWAKAALIKAGLDLGQGLVVAAALLTGALTLYSMMSAWAEMFWKPQPTEEEGGLPESERPYPMQPRERMLRFGPIIGLTVAILAMGLQPGVFFRVAERAAGQLLDTEEYITAVRSIRTPRPEWDEVKERLRDRGINPDGSPMTPTVDSDGEPDIKPEGEDVAEPDRAPYEGDTAADEAAGEPES